MARQQEFANWINSYYDNNQDADFESDDVITALMEAAAAEGFTDEDMDNASELDPGPNAPVGTEQLGISEDASNGLNEEDKQYLRETYGAKFPEDADYDLIATKDENTELNRNADTYSSELDPNIEHTGGGTHHGTGHVEEVNEAHRKNKSQNSLARLIGSLKI
jgi:hypothetical protein